MLITASKINDLNSLVWQYGLFYIFFTRQRSHYWVTNFAMYLLLLSTLPWLPTLDGKVDEQGESEHETRKPCQCLITILALLTLILVTFAALKSRVISNGCSGWSYASSMKHESFDPFATPTHSQLCNVWSMQTGYHTSQKLQSSWIVDHENISPAAAPAQTWIDLQLLPILTRETSPRKKSSSTQKKIST